MLKQSIIKINNVVRRTSLKMVLLAAILAAPVLSLASAQPARAAWACYEGQVCIYNLVNGEGQAYGFTIANSSYCFNLPNYANDMADSYFNRSSRTLSFYTAAGCGGTLIKSGIRAGYYGNIPYFCEGGQESNCRNKLTSIRVH